VATLEPPGLLSALSRRILPSFLQQGRPQSAVMSTEVVSRPAELPAGPGSGRVAASTTSARPGSGASFDPQERSLWRETPRSGPAALFTHAESATVPAYTVFVDYPYSGPVPVDPTDSSQPPPLVGLYGVHVKKRHPRAKDRGARRRRPRWPTGRMRRPSRKCRPSDRMCRP